MTDCERRVLHIDMDAFFASIEQQVFPFLRGKPIGVCGDPNGRTVIAAASYEAKRRGVKTAMTIPEAKKLCPEIILVPGNPARYVDTSTRILTHYATYTDLVEIFSIDEAFLDVTHTAHLFGGAEAIARNIKVWLKSKLGLTCSIGIAPNKLLAKLVGDMHKPDGLTVVQQSEVAALLRDLPVQKLCGIGRKTESRLTQLGIRTCGELGSYDEKILVAVFGINGSRLKRMGQGIDESPVMPYHHEPATKSMGHSLTLERDTKDIAVIQRHLLQLSEQVGHRLRKDGYAGRTISLILRYADFSTFVKQRSLSYYIDDGYRIYRVGLRLFTEIYKPQRLVRLLGISVSNLAREFTQEVMFTDRRVDSLFDSTDVINNRYGEFSIARAKLQDRSRGPRVISPSWRPPTPTPGAR
ncbi:MAG: DNA polymerase IV [candidate division WOR-3 bacterium]